VVGSYTAVRCALLGLTCSDAISCGVAGGLAVAVPTALDPARVAFLQSYYAAVLGSAVKGAAAPKAVPAHFVIATSAFSGALLIGGTDMLAHRLLGVRW
jgi:hypothetical protein